MAEQKVSLVFEGSGELIPFLQEAREEVNGLYGAHTKAQAGIRSDLKKTAEEVTRTGQTYNAASKLVVALAQSAQQGVPQLIRNLSAVADLSETIGASLSEADKANFSAVNAGLREVAKNEKIIISDLEDAKKARIDALVEAKKLTAEEGNLLKQVQAVVDTFKKLDKVKLPAVSLPGPGGSVSDGAPPDELLANARALREAYSAAANEAEAIGEQFGKNSAAFTQAAQIAEKLKKELTASVAQGGTLAQRMKAAQVEAEKIAKASGINTKEFDEAARAAAEVKAEVEATNAALGVQAGEVETVRQQYRAALVAAQELAQTPGPEYDAALAEVARLKKLLDDTAASVRNLNPGDKVRAFTQLGNAIASGAQAIGGAAIAFGGNNQALQETLFKFQSALFALQGAQTFLRDFGDALNDVRRVLGLNTIEQVKNTVATEADIVAKEGQAAATTTATTATAAATTGIKAFTASILASPLLPFVLLLTAAAAVIATISNETKNLKKNYAELLDEIQKGFDTRNTQAELDNARALLEIEEERLRLLVDVKLGKVTQAQADKEYAEARRIAERNYQNQVRQGLIDRQKAEQKAAEAVQRAYDQLAEGSKATEGQKQAALQFLGFAEQVAAGEKVTADEIEKAYEEMYAARVESAKRASVEVYNIDAKARTDASGRIQEDIDKQRELAKTTRDIREQLAAQIEAIEKELADKLRELETGQADPLARLAIERKVADEQLALLERNLRREIALQELRVKIGTQAFQELSEAQKKAAADAIIEDGGGQLSTRQAEAFAQARLLIEKDFLRRRVELQREFDATLAEASGDAQVQQLAELDALLVEREKKLREAGASEVQIAEDAARQVAITQEKLASERLAQAEQTELDILGAKLAAAKGQPEAERAIQEEILAVKLEYAEKALALIVDDESAQSAARIAAAKRTIAELKAELAGLTAGIRPFRLSDLFDIDPRYADQFDAAAKDIAGSLLDLSRAATEAQQIQLDQQIAVTDQIIEDLQRRGDELQQQLDRDLELNKEGLANNLNATLAAIEENKKAEKAALAEKKRIQAEQAKLARQQVIIDSASQASSLAVSAANTIKGFSGIPFGAGILPATALILQFVAFFAGLRNKLAAVAQPQQFFRGTKSVQLDGNPDGVDTVPAMLTRDEAVIPVAENRKHRGLVGAIIDDDFSKLTPEQLKPIIEAVDLSALLKGTGVVLNEEAAQAVVTMNNTYRERVEKAHAVDVRGMERRLDELTAEVKSFRKQEGAKPETVTLPDGTIRVKRPGHTEYIRP